MREALRVEAWEKTDPYDQMTAEAASTPPGAEGLIFLPYLSGERTPHADPFARGAFVGLTLRHRREHLVRAVLEGVALGLRDAFEILRAMGVATQEVRISVGGARSPLWRQILADVLGTEVATVTTTEGTAYGAALLAGVRVGAFVSVEAACERTVHVVDRTSPGEAGGRYEELYRVYVELYPVLRRGMHVLGRLR
ncbi:MAG: FGGY-family carbohydrate kinase [Armatimonadetes bacterium]|nr:FGGY-family carbohydrate kinase [Armatimonadota bacterium]MDW8153466.1 FGGY-family carbohydrate kinase [Armatimonadota bacterium]